MTACESTDTVHGMKYLEAVREIFGVGPAKK